jgi:recombination associated protein RdgC
MLFKQVQIYQLTAPIHSSPTAISEKLESFIFKPCLPSMPTSTGWVPPVDEEDAPLSIAINGCIMICLQTQDKILPASVIRQELNALIKQREVTDARKIRHKEKLSLKDEVVTTLLPRAFSKLSRLYAYIDTRNNWLVIGSANAKKTEQFLSFFKKAISEQIRVFDIKKLAPVLTQWLKNQNYPKNLAVEKSCVLQDPEQQKRIIRCQQQDLFANPIQNLIKDGCEAKQLALTWQDRVNFVLSDDFSLTGIKFQDDLIAEAKDMEAETKLQILAADFLIMSETFSLLLTDLLNLFMNVHEAKQALPA